MQQVQIQLEELRALATQCLEQNGCDTRNAEPVANSMAAADRDGCSSHGVFRLPGYVTGLRSGAINGKAIPTVNQISPGVIKVDGGHAMAPVAHAASFEQLADLAHTVGVACLALTRVHHFSALWVEAEELAARGVVSFACTSYMPVVTPAGGAEPVFGTNPIAFGWPRRDRPPMIFDMATAAMARGEIMIAQRENKQLPHGVGVDREGNPSVVPAEVLAGAQLAFGGYKGAALALMVELLAGPLIGETLSIETQEQDRGDGAPPSGGEFILALAPEHFGDAERWQEHAEAMFEKLAAVTGARLAGDRRYRNRERNLMDGVSLPAKLVDDIRHLADEGISRVDA